EVDFCLRAWASGRRVVYEPAAVVRHYEFATAGPDRAVELQQRNRSLLIARHDAALEAKSENVPGNVLKARVRAAAARRIQVIDDAVPHPFEGSGGPRLRAI